MNFFDHIKGLISNKTEYTKGIYALFKLEAKLAGLNLVPCLIGLVALLALAITTWLSLMVLMGYVFILYTANPLIAIVAVLGLNFAIAIYLIFAIKQRVQQNEFCQNKSMSQTTRSRERK